MPAPLIFPLKHRLNQVPVRPLPTIFTDIPNPYFTCGAECSLTTAQAGHWDAITGAGPTLETSIIGPNGGINSHKFTTTGATSYQAHLWSLFQVAYRVYFNVGVLPDQTTTILQNINASGNASVKLSSGGQIRIRMGASAADINVGSAVAANTWHYLDYALDTSGPIAWIRARLDGGTEATDNVSQATNANTALREGIVAGIMTVGTIYFDHVYAASIDAYPIGVGYVTGTSYLNEVNTGAPAGVSLYSRSGSDTIATVSDSPSRVLSLIRSLSDTVTTVTESVARVLALIRTVSESYFATCFALAPVSYWRLGESSGTVAVDAMGSNNGTYTNAPTLGATGALTGDTDTAVTFASASSQYVTIPHAAALHPGDVISISAWFKRATSGAAHAIWSNGPTDALLWIFSDNHLYFSREGVGNMFASTATITDTNWHHVVATKNGATTIVYYDGAVMAGSGSNQTLTDSGAASTIGRDSGSDYFNGTIDEPAIWNRALSAAEVATLYAAGTTAPVSESVARVLAVLRPLADTITTVSESVARATLSLVRTAADTVTTVNETVARAAIAFSRTVSDAITTVSESVGRVLALIRTLSDTNAIGTSSATRAALTLARTASDTITTVSEAIARVLTLLRTATDTVTTVSETVARAAIAFARAASDTVTTVTESVVALKVFLRTATDTVTTVSESVARGAIGFVRTIADTITTVSEAVVRVLTIPRAISDTITTASATAAQIKVLIRSVSDNVSGVTDAVARILAATRAIAEATTTSDVVVRIIALGRSAADTVTGITDSIHVSSGALPIAGLAPLIRSRLDTPGLRGALGAPRRGFVRFIRPKIGRGSSE